MDIKKKYLLRFTLILLWFLGLAIFHFKFSYQEISIDKLPQTYRFFSDSAFGGISTCEQYKKGDTIVFEYKLIKKDEQYTFTNQVTILDEPIDVSSYDNFEYTLKGDYPNRLRLFLVMEVPEDTINPVHTIEYFKEYGTNFETHKIPLQEFQYHEYWLNTANINENDLGEFNFSNMKALVFGSGSIITIDRDEKIEFHSVKFTKTITWPYFLFLGILIFGILYWLINTKIKNKEEIVSIKYNIAEENNKKNFLSTVEYISQNYMNPIISATMVCDELNISHDKLSNDIKKETTLTFKELLNQLRIEEAKRLLVETDYLVSKIAILIGYENVTNFNRVFKSLLNLSPSEFRKLSKDGKL